MSAIQLEQTSNHLARQVRRWDRRLRLATSVLWGPRGVIAGLVIGIVIAVISRLRPWLLPEQVAEIAIGVAVLSGLGVLGAIWLWPRTLPHAARYFDRRFELRERISTALEMASGVIPAPARLVERQVSDAASAAQRVNLAARLPVRARFWELLMLVVLGGLLAYMLAMNNPQVEELMARRNLQHAIAQQAGALDQAIQDIRQNDALTLAEKDTLTAPLEEARDILRQPDVSQPEAIAALAEAGQSLQELSGGMPPDQQAAYQQAASALAGSDLAADVARGLRQPDLRQTADALDDLAEEIGRDNLPEDERLALADRLDEAANALQEHNPALAELFHQAAQALREGNMQAAQQALQDAAQLLREQQEQLENSPLAEAAQAALSQVDRGQRELAQAGQQDTAAQSPDQENQSGQQTGQGQQSGLAQQSQQDGQSGDGMQQQGEGQAQVMLEDDSPDQETGQSDSGVIGDEPGGDEGTGPQVATQGDASLGGAGGSEVGSSAPAAGAGAGGSGVDDVAGLQADEAGQIPANTTTSDGGAIQEYTADSAPFALGGQSDQVVDVGGQIIGPDGLPLQQGEFGPNPAGESVLSYRSIFNSYRAIISEALQSGRIPLDQRDVIHDYFSSLEP